MDSDALTRLANRRRSRLDLAQRKRSFGPGWQHVLAVQPGTLADERALHARFAEHVVSGREYFTPAPDLIAYINEIRLRLGVEPFTV